MYDPKYQKQIDAFDEYLTSTPPNTKPLAEYKGEWIIFKKMNMVNLFLKKIKKK